MLWKLAVRNVKKSYRDYLVYFLTLCFSVCLFYTFNSFKSQKAVLIVTKTQSEIMDSTGDIIYYLSILIAVILGFLILYAGHYLIKRRKQELATYMILGMETRDTARMLTYETMIIGMVSLISGLFLGVFLSQIMSMITAQLFLAEVSQYRVFFSVDAFILTIIAFCIIFIIMICFYQILLRKYSLQTLLHAKSRNEKALIRSIPVSILCMILSIILLAYAYHVLLRDGFLYAALNPIMLVSGVIGTFLFFFSLSGFFLKLVQTSKGIYLRNLNMFIMRQLHASINSSFLSISIICLMLLLSIGAISSGLSVTNALNRDVQIYTPVDASITFYSSKGQTLKSFLGERNINTDELFNEVNDMNIIGSNDLKLTDLWKYMDQDMINAKLKHVGEMPIQYITLSQFQVFQKQAGEKAINLKPGEVYLGATDEVLCDSLSTMIKHTDTLPIYHQKLKIKNGKTAFFAPINLIDSNNSVYMVVTDDFFNQHIALDSDFTNTNYNITFKKNADITPLYDITIPENGEYFFDIVTREKVYETKSQLTVTFSYVGMYLGIVFLLASCVLLALHQLTLAEENRSRYMTLRKLGVEEKMINHSIYLQIGVYFVLPLLLAIVHSYVGITAISDVIILMGKGNIFGSSLITAGIIALIYLAYFYAAYQSYRYILKNQKN